ncbi:MAG: EFR1 family ferrodoxin [Oscillospiraceae bacterium]|nr:EFR1 family ferrodoxin [Oscillospiraceae bacterium]
MLGVYFSGTGNTKFCLEKFCYHYDGSKPLSIEDSGVIEAISKSEEIALAYPIYYSNTPKIIKDFIRANSPCFANKRVYIIATMGLFSGDGAGCGARLLKKCGARIIGGLHLKMPDCIGDVKALKKPLEQNRQIVNDAEQKITQAVNALKQGKPTKEGLGFFYHVAGLFGQRLWFYGKTTRYTDKLKIEKSICVGCGKCVALCPMKNIKITDKKASASDGCTMCYRCINSCPNKAITLLGKEVVEQCNIDNYMVKQP